MRTGYINYCRSEHAESFSNILSDMVTDDTLSPTDMLPLPLLSILDNKLNNQRSYSRYW